LTSTNAAPAKTTANLLCGLFCFWSPNLLATILPLPFSLFFFLFPPCISRTFFHIRPPCFHTFRENLISVIRNLRASQVPLKAEALSAHILIAVKMLQIVGTVVDVRWDFFGQHILSSSPPWHFIQVARPPRGACTSEKMATCPSWPRGSFIIFWYF